MVSFRDTHDPSKYNRLKRRSQLGRMNSQGLPWASLLAGLLALAAVAFVASDVQSHGSFEASDTAVYSRLGFAWLRTNLPIFCAECARVLGPLAQQALETSRTAARFVSKQIVWLIVRFKKNNPAFVEWVNANTPDAAYQVLAYVQERSLFVHENYVLPGAAYAWERLQGAWNDLQQ